jgi:hypothetical protein
MAHVRRVFDRTAGPIAADRFRGGAHPGTTVQMRLSTAGTIKGALGR